MANKKPAATKKSSPSDQLVKAVHSALKKQKFGGTMIVKNALQEADNPCPNGGTPHEISYQLPNGTWVSKIVCL